MRSACGVCVCGGALLAIALGLTNCQFPEYDLARGGSGGSAGAGGDATEPLAGGAGAAPTGATSGTDAGGAPSGRNACGVGKACATVPAGWLGPVASWEGQAGEVAPDCPAGFGEPNDLHRGMDAPAASCKCSCAAEGQVCDQSPTVAVYLDLGCQTQCANPAPLTCASVSGCNGNQGTMHADKAAPSGGSCRASVATTPGAAASWQRDARLCAWSSDDSGSCTGTGELCVPTPEPPFASQLCVMQVVPEGQALPACPAEYPNSGAVLYSKFSDDRSCSACSCSGPTGGSCAGTLTLSTGDACGSGFAYTLGSGCQAFALATQPTHLSASYTLEPGACGIASDSHPTGSAQPSGSATVVCCL